MIRWLPAAAIVGAVSFALPETGLTVAQQGHALIASMAVIALFIAIAARDLVVLLIDVAAVAGVLLMLFGFREIMRTRDIPAPRPRRGRDEAAGDHAEHRIRQD